MKKEYLTVEDPKVLWKNLKERYDHQKLILLPRARNDWQNLRFQDFKSVTEHDSALFETVSILTLCDQTKTDAEMIEKTLSTFHANNVLLQQQYRVKNFQKYSELISCLLVAEQNNNLLLRNHNTRPTGSQAIPEANATSNENDNQKNYGSNHGGRGGYRGGRNGNGYGGKRYSQKDYKKPYHQEKKK